MKIFGREFGKKAATQIPPPFGMRYTANGFVYSDGTNEVLLRDGFGLNSTVYSIVSIMAKKYASIPRILYKVKDKQQAKAERYKSLTRDIYTPGNLLERIKLKSAAFDEITDTEHEILTLYNKPNAHQTGSQFRELQMIFLKSTGACPMVINKGLSGMKPLSLEIYPTQFIILEPDETLQSFRRAAYTITGEHIELDIDNFIYWKYPNPNYSLTGDHLYGLNPLKAAAKVLCSDNENMDAQAFTFKHKGSTGVFTPKTLADAQAATTEKEAIRLAVDDRANGRDYGKLRTYLNVPMDLHTYGFTAEEMASLDIHIQNKEDLCNPYNFPPLLVINAKGTDARYTDAIKYLVTNTIYNDLTGERDIWNETIIPAFGYKEGEYFLDFDLSALAEMQEDMEKLVSSVRGMVQDGLINRNEGRAVLKYDEIANPLMNEFTVTGNVQPLSAAFEVMENIDDDELD